MGIRFFDKLGFQMIQQNQAFMRCPHDVKGVFFDLRLMAGNSEYEDGTIPIGSVKKAKLDDVLDYLTDYDRSKRNLYKKVLTRLQAVGVISVTAAGVIKIPYYEEEQDLGRTPNANRMRRAAETDLLELVNRAGMELKGLFRQSHALQLPYDTIVQHLRGVFHIYTPKAQEILTRMRKSGVLVSNEDSFYSLASLGSPPESGPGVGSGPQLYASHKIAVVPDSDSDEEGTNVPSTDPTETRGRGSADPQPTCASGTDGELPSEARGKDGAFAVGDGIPISPEEAWEVKDPLQAAEAFLRSMPGWSEKQEGDNPPSKFSLRGYWRDLRKAVGPQQANKIWRQALFDIITDHHDKQSWRSWTAGFMSKVKIGQECFESLKAAE